ncbi:LOW QUALITY PROTEIN: hypothetical protein U0070_022075 [Myodes glareolus]|uniref:Uncharacterized protein n=1 Tax=Myodes glareolus TaxID=447135 RepID=A0AAW0HQS4_MYOGA
MRTSHRIKCPLPDTPLLDICKFVHTGAHSDFPIRDSHNGVKMEGYWMEEREAESDGEVECDLNDLGTAEELRQYFLETEKHREEQRQQPELDVEQEPGGDVNADHDLYHNRHPSVDQWNPQKPGALRQAETKRLYGDGAPKILAIEASLQLRFDKKYDGKQPQVLA